MSRHLIRSYAQTALDFVFPAECPGCKNFAGDERVLIFCKSCWESIPLINGPVCPKCGRPFSSKFDLQHSPNFLCGDCRSSPPHFDRAFSVAEYEGILKQAIGYFKFHQKTALGTPLGRLFISHLSDAVDWAQYQSILPVPLHKKRLRRRGYNQSAILARPLARHFKLDLQLDNLRRIRHTEAQWPIKERHERRKNVRNAFSLRAPEKIQERNIILIDDIFTTGATTNECARMLKQAGAVSVLVLTLSRAGI
ncbi:MAG: ComF family protein [bacterium]|nr:ComF family protein [bacterium]